MSAAPAQADRASAQPCGQAARLGYCLYPGAGPLLVLLSGLGNDSDRGRPRIEALNRLAGLLVHDRRGYGLSAALPPQPLTAEAVADGLERPLQALRIRATTWSWGGDSHGRP